MKLVILHHHLVSMNDSMYSPFCTESLYIHIRICYVPYPETQTKKRSPSMRVRGRGKGRGEKTTRQKSLPSGMLKQPICFPLNFTYIHCCIFQGIIITTTHNGVCQEEELFLLFLLNQHIWKPSVCLVYSVASKL